MIFSRKQGFGVSSFEGTSFFLRRASVHPHFHRQHIVSGFDGLWRTDNVKFWVVVVSETDLFGCKSR